METEGEEGGGSKERDHTNVKSGNNLPGALLLLLRATNHKAARVNNERLIGQRPGQMLGAPLKERGAAPSGQAAVLR